MNLKKAYWLLSLPALLTLNACSESSWSVNSSSDSSTSISETSSSPFISSSDSSRTPREKYERDLSNYAKEYALSSSTTPAAFRSKVGQIAQKYGVLNWESDNGSYIAIGKGFRQAKLNGTQYQAFKTSLVEGQPDKGVYLDQGYKP
jgi:hypothetical protein